MGDRLTHPYHAEPAHTGGAVGELGARRDHSAAGGGAGLTTEVALVSVGTETLGQVAETAEIVALQVGGGFRWFRALLTVGSGEGEGEGREGRRGGRGRGRGVEGRGGERERGQGGPEKKTDEAHNQGQQLSHLSSQTVPV